MIVRHDRADMTPSLTVGVLFGLWVLGVSVVWALLYAHGEYEVTFESQI